MEVQLPKKQITDIGHFYDFVKSPSGVLEAFFIKPSGEKATRYYDERGQFIREVVAFNHYGFTCYAGLQPRNPKLLETTRAATDSDIVAFRLLYMDLDPVRPKGINATHEEKERCLQVALSVQKKLCNGMGYQNPLLTSSGNGNWLILPIPEITVTDTNREAIRRRLKTWGKKARENFEKDGVKIDTEVYDLRRLCKIPGTQIFNCPAAPDRPQRVSQILSETIPTPDEKLKDDFLSMPVCDPTPTDDYIHHILECHPDRVLKRCYLLRFLKEKADAGENIPHRLRLGLSTLSLAFGDLENDLQFITQVIGGCPDFSPEKTRHYLENNKGKSAPWGCEALRRHVLEHFKDFEPDRCNCNLESRNGRQPSPVRFASPDESAKERKKSQADVLVELVTKQDPYLFHDRLQEPYAVIKTAGHNEIRRVRSVHFKRWMRRLYWAALKKAPNAEAVANAGAVIESIACFDGSEHEVHNRVAWANGNLYYDLSDGKWRVVEITSEGWKTLDHPPVYFRRMDHQMPQTEPVAGGRVHEVFDFVNIPERVDQILFLSVLVSSFVPGIPHPIPILHGEQGSAKSYTLKILRRLIDPSQPEALSFPRDTQELVQKLDHHWCGYFDNVSNLSDWVSDMLCRAVTGEGFSKRRLYTDDEDVIFSFQRCLGLNGVTLVATKPDLLDRSILFGFERIPPHHRRREAELDTQFEKVRGRILGAIFDVLAQAVEGHARVDLSELPRMADFAVWGAAIAEALGYERDEFLAAYTQNIRTQNTEALQAHPVGLALLHFLEGGQGWEGTPNELLEMLQTAAEELRIDTKARATKWPRTPNWLTRRINEVRTNLREEGWEVTVDHSKERIIRITRSSGSTVPTRRRPGNTVDTVDTVETEQNQPVTLDSIFDGIDDKTKILSNRKSLKSLSIDDNDGNDGISRSITDRGTTPPSPPQPPPHDGFVEGEI